MINHQHTCLTKIELDMLSEGKISRHDLEKKADVCLFCNDALEGFGQIDKVKRDEFLNLPYQHKETKSSIRPFFFLKIASALLIGFASFYFFSKSNNSLLDNTSLVAEYKPKETLSKDSQTRGVASVQNQILIAFDDGNYQEAINEIEALDKKAYNNYFKMIKGICYFELEDINKASELFNHIENIESLLNDKVGFYQVLIDLKKNNTKEAKSKLNKILTQEDHDYWQEAKNLLKKLN